jgi:tetratricopeptide (TPR) repeat protein
MPTADRGSAAVTKKGGFPRLRPTATKADPADSGPADARPAEAAAAQRPIVTDVSSAGCVALAARIGADGVELADDLGERLYALATADCVLARAQILGAAGRRSARLELLRQSWRMAPSRQAAIAMTFRAAAEDEEFRHIVADADAARDRGDWPAAGALYGRAVALYPLHHGYLVQLGHMLKEQDRFEGAEIAYRSALTLGAPLLDVARHLAFACERQGYDLGEPPRPAPAAAAMQEPPTAFDIDALGHLFWHETTVADADKLALLRACRTCEAAAAMMVADPRFVRRNGQLLKLLKSRA